MRKNRRFTIRVYEDEVEDLEEVNSRWIKEIYLNYYRGSDDKDKNIKEGAGEDRHVAALRNGWKASDKE